MLISRGSRHVQLGFVRKAVRADYWAPRIGPRVGDRRNSVTERHDVFGLDARCQVQKRKVGNHGTGIRDSRSLTDPIHGT